jgi:hydrogenase-4 component F
MIAAMILIPSFAALLCVVVRHNILRRLIVVAAAASHLSLVAAAWAAHPAPILGGWLGLDELGHLFLSIVSVLFFAASIYAFGYLSRQAAGEQNDFEDDGIFTNAPEAIFCMCLLAFLAAMTLATASQHLGLLWVAMEATTLASAPLIYFHRHHRSLEATWKYLLICSVGIAIAMLGNFFMVFAASRPGAESTSLVISELIKQAASLDSQWLKVAFIFLLVGYGTKMGLAPLHTWLPDAHSESPSVVSALLSGALLNCAFLGILRVHQICIAAGLADFSSQLLMVFGLISVAWATMFIWSQADYKRLLAYSSVEHMGILALGVGAGGVAVFGAMLHAVNHSLTKAMLFMVAGNILAAYRTKLSKDVTGLISVRPVSGFLWLAGLLAITGVPPFGIFVSEFTILKSIFDGGRFFTAAAFLILLAGVFAAMSRVFINMTYGGVPRALRERPTGESFTSIAPAAVFCAATLLLGLYLPAPMSEILHKAASLIGGN